MGDRRSGLPGGTWGVQPQFVPIYPRPLHLSKFLNDPFVIIPPDGRHRVYVRNGPG